MNKLRILYQDSHYVVIDKPAGFSVHPPENPQHQISRTTNCIYLLREQLGQWVYPIHRLDRATSGVLIMALSSEAAQKMSQNWKHHQKNYYAVVRGWESVSTASTWINRPLKNEEGVEKNSLTEYSCIANFKILKPIRNFPEARYSLLSIQLHTGRRHQIRRHFSGISRPLLGDTLYGPSEHNKLAREFFGLQMLFLKAYSLTWIHPYQNKIYTHHSKWNSHWLKIFDLSGICPYSVTT